MEPPRVPLSRHLTPAQLVAIDAAAAALLAVALTELHRSHPPYTYLDVPAVAVIVMIGASAAGIALRRVRPLTSLAVALAGESALIALGLAADPMIMVAAVLYTVAQVKSRRTAAGALAAVGLALVILVFIAPPTVPPGTAVNDRIGDNTGHAAYAFTVLLAAWAAGRAVRAGRAYAAGLREQAERRAQATVDQARRTVAEERLRIARELHDVVAHSMSVVAVQAGVGRYVIDTDPAEAASALAAIETTSRTALREMRQLLGILRDGEPGEMLASPSLDDLPELARRTGLQVDVAVRGTPRQLPAGMDLTAFRIVQEALTNVVKHSGTGRGRVEVTYSADAVTVEVTDEGAGGAAPGNPGGGNGRGQGLTGMRERVALYGGDFSAGPRPERGYRVHARLPTGAAA
jgi:signal transduction histidine kinase